MAHAQPPQHLGGDRWRVTVSIGHDKAGRRVRASRVIRAADARTAARLAEETRVDLRREAEQSRASVETVRGYVKVWLGESRQRLSPRTLEGYERIGAEIVARWGSLRVDQITPADIREWYADLAAGGMTAATIESRHRVLRIVLRQAVDDEIVVRPATAAVKRGKLPEHEVKLPPDGRIAEAIAKLDGRIRVAVQLAAACGLRRGEVCGLRWSDIDWDQIVVQRAVIRTEQGALVVKSTKGNRSRRIAVNRGTVSVLRAHRRLQRDQALQLGVEWNRDGFLLADLAADPSGETPMDPDKIARDWIAARGTLRMRFHDLRHWCASTLIDLGMSIADVSAIIGHAQVSTTANIYTHQREEASKRRRAARLMGRKMAG